MKYIKRNQQKMLTLKLPVFIGNWLDDKLPFFNTLHYGTDYYEHNKTFVIYLN